MEITVNVHIPEQFYEAEKAEKKKGEKEKASVFHRECECVAVEHAPLLRYGRDGQKKKKTKRRTQTVA